MGYSLTIYIQSASISLDEKTKFKETKFESAAKGIYNTLDTSLRKEYSEKKIQKWLLNLDADDNGEITYDELVKAGGDKYNILKMSDNTTQKEHDNLQAAIVKEQELDGIKGMEIALKQNEFTWQIAKNFLYKYTDKDSLIEMFQSENVREYYEQMVACENCQKHMKELIAHHSLTEKDLRDMQLTDTQIKDLLG